ncbi:hypothetical protein V8E36_007759 [Tilletia maclaganii]
MSTEAMDFDLFLSAVTKVWNTPELVLEIMSYFVLERNDLITLSTVSKQLRVLALSLLVETMDVPLSRVKQNRNLIQDKPELAASIKHIRVWDDELEIRLRGRPHSKPTILATPLPRRREPWNGLDEEERHEHGSFEGDYRWFELGAFLNSVCRDRSTRIPKIDLTFALNNAFDVNGVFEDDVGIQDFVAVRVIPDRGEGPDMDEYPEVWNQFVDDAKTLWAQVGHSIAQTRHEATNSTRAFSVDDFLRGDNHHWCSSTSVWNAAKAAYKDNVERLSIRISADEDNSRNACALLDADWPQLRSLSLTSTETGLMHWDEIQSRIDDFLSRHPHLEDIHITADGFFEPAPFPQDFPNLKKCSVDKTTPPFLGDFIARHHRTLTDLTIPRVIRAEEFSNILPDASRVPNLTVLRSEIEVAAMFVSQGARIRHYQFEEIQYFSDLQLDQWLLPTWAAAEAVTCLDIEVSRHDIQAVIVRLLRVLPAVSIPNLFELSVCSTENEDVSLQSVEEGVVRVRDFLAALHRHKRLRAVRIEHMGARPFPFERRLEFDLKDAPPRLRYVSWHAPTHNHTQYFRMIPLADSQDALGKPTRAPAGLLPC